MNEQDQKHFERPTSHTQEFPMVKRLVYLVLVVALGIVTGAAGFLIASSQAPAPQYTAYPTNAIINELQPQSGSRIVYDASTAARAQTVSILKTRSRTTDAYDEMVDPSEYMGSGVIATSDGLIMTAVSASQLAKVAVMIRGSIYPAEKVSTDPITGVSFLKIEARALTPVSISTVVDAGEMIVANGPGTGIAPRPVVARVLQRSYVPIRTRADYIRSSDALGEYSLIEAPLELTGERAYFTGEGKFAGFAVIKSAEVLLIPSNLIRLALEQSLRQEISKDLGIYYFVNQTKIEDESPVGITVYHPTRAAVRPASLAAKAGLRKGDSILSIDGESITQNASFDYLWKKHQNDDGGVQLIITRNGVKGPIQISW